MPVSPQKGYGHQKIEAKWRQIWEEAKLFQGQYLRKADLKEVNSSDKFYILPQLPYPSASGLHMGHSEVYTACDIYARYQRMHGKKVLQVIGWDAFGLPAENYAIKTNVHPRVNTDKAIDNFREQIKSLGISVDWEREVGSHNPDYYKWTQWFFLLMYKRGLAYRKMQSVNWCEGCKTVLANEQVVDGKCERCDTEVIQKNMKQWFFRITQYADRLAKDLDKVDWPQESVRRQRDWIGRKDGINIEYQIEGLGRKVICFTTRPDTTFGATFIVLSPENPLVKEITSSKQRKEVDDYINQSSRKTELERISQDKEKTGVFTGAYAVNPINNKETPVWIADYVLMSYGTGAVMGVPAHDKRDFEFAAKYRLPIIQVIARNDMPIRSYLMGAENITDEDLMEIGVEIAKKLENGDRKIEIPEKSLQKYEKLISDKLTPGYWNEYVGVKTVFIFKHKNGSIQRIELNPESEKEIDTLATQFAGENLGSKCVWKWLSDNDWYKNVIVHEEHGILINSGEFSNLESSDSRKKIIEKLESKGKAKFTVKYKLRDWSVSRQRFWGAPIPMVYDPKGYLHPISEKDLPVLLPDDVDFKPTGQSPLTYSCEFQKGVEKKYGKGWRREVDTLDTFMCSSWYYYRYLDPCNTKAFASQEALKKWMPVDFYLGGPEHVNGHLLYSRFFTKVLHDAGYIDFDEPFLVHRHQGMILGENNKKMSKRWGNVINPINVVREYGADTARMYLMFMGPLTSDKPWSTNGVVGVRKFISRLYGLVCRNIKEKPAESRLDLKMLLNKTVKEVSADCENLKFNTSIAKFMEFVNDWEKTLGGLSLADLKVFLKILAPFAPYISEELYQIIIAEEVDASAGVKKSSSAVNRKVVAGSLAGKDQFISIHVQSWPEYDKTLVKDETVDIAVQVNGKLRAVLKDCRAGSLQNEIEKKAKEQVQKYLGGQALRRVIYIKDRLINLVA